MMTESGVGKMDYRHRNTYIELWDLYDSERR